MPSPLICAIHALTRSSDRVRLVVLVAREADELAAVDRLGLLVLVALDVPRADNLGALRLEAAGQLLHRIAEVVAVAGLVAEAEDGDLLALEVHGRQVTVQELVPSGARALGVGAGVPRGRAADEAVE